MEVDHDLTGQGTPPGTPFEDGFTPSTTRGHTTSIPTRHTRIDNYYTPLIAENQETDPPNDAANQQTPTHGDTGAADQAAAGETGTHTADDAEAEAAAAAGATFAARLAAEREAAEAGTAAANEVAAIAAAREAEEALTGETAETTAQATTATEAANQALEAAATAEAEKNRKAALKAARAAKAAHAAVEKLRAAAAAAAKAKGKQALEPQKDKAVGGDTGDTRTTAQHTQDGNLPTELDDWELSEGGLPEGSTLSGSKALLDGPPGDEADSREHKRTNTGKSNEGNPPTTE
jgi:hypothetical protein